MAFWWDRKHLELVYPITLPVLIPGLAITQVACLALNYLAGDGLLVFLGISVFAGLSTLLVSLFTLGVIERHIRGVLRHRAPAQLGCNDHSEPSKP